MKNIYLLFCIFMVIDSSISQAFIKNDSTANVLNLKDSVQYAIEHSPSFDSLKKTLNISELEEKSALAKNFPSLDLTTTHGIKDNNADLKLTSSAQPWYSDFNLALTENIYDNGASYTRYKISSLSKKQSLLNSDNQKNKICLDIVKQFVYFSLNFKLLQIQEKQFELINKQYSSIYKDYSQGLKTKNDYLRFKTQVSRSEIDLINAKNNLEKSKIELKKLIGLNLSNDTQINFEPINLDYKISSLDQFNQNLVIENHPLYQISQIQKEINQLNSEQIHRKNLPEFFITAGLNYTSSNYLNNGQTFSDNDQLGWNALLTLKYNFFDWGIRARDQEISYLKEKISNNSLDTDLLSLNSELQQLKLTSAQIIKNYSLAQELLNLEKTNLNFIEREYKNGKVQYLDLIAVINNLSDAEIKFYTSASEAYSLHYTYLHHQGKLYDDLIK